jgi:hypothetical protein
MLRTIAPLAASVALLVPTALAAQTERAAFITMLGNDTIAVERMVRDADSLRAEVLLRVPRTTLTVYRMQLGRDGMPTSMQSTRHDPVDGTAGAVLGSSRIDWAADGLRVQPGGDAEAFMVEGGRDVLPFIDMVHWPFDLMLNRAHAAGGESTTIPLLAGRRTQDFAVRRTGERAYTVTHPTRGTMTVEVDAQGRVAHLDAAGTTRAVRVKRVEDVDIDHLARVYAAHEAQAGPLGSLSGRGSHEAMVAGANLSLDFGVPRKRGREIFGALVPYGQVWRTGADRATHFTTDRDLVIGGAAVPAGTYTLFTVPGPDTWTLMINTRTNINGQAYDAEHDLARVEMRTRTLDEEVEEFEVRAEPTDRGGELRIRWDRTEAYVPMAAAGSR